MNIERLIKQFKEGNKIQILPCLSSEVICPYCQEEIAKYYLKDNKISCDVWRNLDKKGYIYNDGDTIMNVEKSIKLTWNQYDSQMLQGQCKKCNKEYVGICIDIISNPINKEFFICDESIFREETVTSELFQININNKKIGILKIFKNVSLANSIHDIDSIYDIYRIDLGAFELLSDLKTEQGIACCSLNEDSYKIWSSATELCQVVINDFVNNHKYLKDNKNI